MDSELIEAATWALIEYDTDVSDRGVRDEHYRERRADVERVLAVFEAAQKPTDDEREVLANLIRRDFYRVDGLPDDEDRAIADVVLEAGFRRTVQGASTDDERTPYLPADLYNRLQMHLLGSGNREALLLAGEVQSLTGASALRRTAVQEPTDAPTVRIMARKGGKTQALIDQMLAQANERGLRVEVVYPQGEPTDAMVLEALNACELSVRTRSGSAKHFTPAPDLSYYSEEDITDMRAALRAALKEGENR